MKVWKYDPKATRSNLETFLQDFRESKGLQLSDAETIPVMLEFLREQLVLAEIEDRDGELSPEQQQLAHFDIVEPLIFHKKVLTAKHEYANTDVTYFAIDFRKFYFWFVQYVEVASISRLVEDGSRFKNQDAA